MVRYARPRFSKCNNGKSKARRATCACIGSVITWLSLTQDPLKAQCFHIASDLKRIASISCDRVQSFNDTSESALNEDGSLGSNPSVMTVAPGENRPLKDIDFSQPLWFYFDPPNMCEELKKRLASPEESEQGWKAAPNKTVQVKMPMFASRGLWSPHVSELMGEICCGGEMLEELIARLCLNIICKFRIVTGSCKMYMAKGRSSRAQAAALQ